MAEEIKVTPEEDVEDPDHVQEMVDKIDNKGEPDSEDTEGELLAGKYETEDDLAKGILEVAKAQGRNPEDLYKELQADLSQANSDNNDDDDDDDVTVDDVIEDVQEPSNDDDVDDGDVTEEVEDLEEEVENGELNVEKYEKEYIENGELSEDSYKELKERGIPEEVVDGYINNQQQAAESKVQEVYEIAGGAEGYKEMVSWAEDNLTDEEISNFNTTINSGVGQAKFAVEALHNRYTEANGSPPKKLVTGGKTPTTGNSDVYNSKAELMEDMKQTKYKKDPAFRKQVSEKLSKSDIL